MNLAWLLIIILSTFLWCPSPQAQMYQWTDESGVKHFSNVSPTESAAEINIGEEHSGDKTAGEKRTGTGSRITRKVNRTKSETRERANPAPENEPPTDGRKAEDNRTVFERERLNMGRFPISQDKLISEEKERLKKIEDYSVRASISRDEMIEREKKRLERAIQDLQSAPLSKFGSSENKRRQVGYYQYRLAELLESPDTYFSLTGD